MPLHQAYQRLQALLRSYGRLAVAFSGGTDSSLLLKAALDTLGPQQVLALFAQSELLKTGEIERVHQWARRNGYESSLTLDVVEIDPLAWPAFRHNPPDRCYLCKKAIYTAFLARIQARGINVLADGTNNDDLHAHRPGLKAIAELGVHTPLVEVGLAKAEIRALGRKMGLSNWGYPSASCLATRLTSGVEITSQRLRWIEQAETAVARLGIKDCRVQLVDGDGKMVIIHLDTIEIAKLLQGEPRAAIVAALKELGASRVLLNLEGR